MKQLVIIAFTMSISVSHVFAGIQAIAAGMNHGLVSTTDGSAWAWGPNDYGDLGDGTQTPRLSPVKVNGLSGVVALAGGQWHSLALRSDGTVASWGGNGLYNVLGNGTTGSGISVLPLQVSDLTGVVAISAGSDFSVALKADGSVWSWGFNLLDGNRSAGLLRVPISGVTAISAGSGYVLAVLNNGTVVAWGGNYKGVLGDGTTTQRFTPVQVIGLTGIVAVAGGGTHSLALKGDGTVWAWGANDYGAVGDGTTTDRLVPTQVKGLTGVIAVAAGPSHSLALKNDGTVWAWGNNTNGQIGDGTVVQRNLPVQVSGLSQVTAVAAGGGSDLDGHSMAITRSGSVWTWGVNQYGELGDGTTIQRTSPVPVSIPGTATVPGAPTFVSGTPIDGGAIVSFSAPTSTGGSPITSYTVTASPGGVAATGANSPITITRLTNGIPYTFVVTAANAAGAGPASAASAFVTPGPPQPQFCFPLSASISVIQSAKRWSHSHKS